MLHKTATFSQKMRPALESSWNPDKPAREPVFSTQFVVWWVCFGLCLRKYFSTLPKSMYPGFAELFAGLSNVMHTAYQCLERAFEVSGKVYPVFAVDV